MRLGTFPRPNAQLIPVCPTTFSIVLFRQLLAYRSSEKSCVSWHPRHMNAKISGGTYIRSHYHAIKEPGDHVTYHSTHGLLRNCISADTHEELTASFSCQSRYQRTCENLPPFPTTIGGGSSNFVAFAAHTGTVTAVPHFLTNIRPYMPLRGPDSFT